MAKETRSMYVTAFLAAVTLYNGYQTYNSFRNDEVAQAVFAAPEFEEYKAVRGVLAKDVEQADANITKIATSNEKKSLESFLADKNVPYSIADVKEAYQKRNQEFDAKQQEINNTLTSARSIRDKLQSNLAAYDARHTSQMQQVVKDNERYWPVGRLWLTACFAAWTIYRFKNRNEDISD